MKFLLFIIGIVTFATANSQTPITAVNTTTSAVASSFSYTNAGNTYNWGISPNNTIETITGITTGGAPYTYTSSLNGIVKIRRVNNAVTTGNFTLVWAQYVLSGTTTFNMFPNYQNDMEQIFDNNILNKGTDNLFDNSSANSNNVERLDWILAGGFAPTSPALSGVAVFERGAPGATTHDPFIIAAITSLDMSGNPASYGNIVRVVAGNYGDPTPAINYRILKGLVPANLLDAGAGSQARGGVFISFQSLGITAGTTIYGYSVFANDLPAAATPAQMVDFNSAPNFPTNTAAAGGIDMVAATGIYIANSVLPVRFVNFNAIENDNTVNLNWGVENEISADHYNIERSTDGINYFKINEVRRTTVSSSINNYNWSDDVTLQPFNLFYYRIKQFDLDGSYYYSKTIAVKKNNKISTLFIYPNPVKENLYININSTINDKSVISVYNAGGALVIQQQELLNKGNNSFTLNDGIGKLAKGVYQLSIKLASGKTITKQFSK